MSFVSQSPSSIRPAAASNLASSSLASAVELGNELLATYAQHSGGAASDRSATDAKRQQLRQRHLALQGQRVGAAAQPPAPPATAAVLALLDSDEGVVKLRVWASLVAAARWAAAQAHDPLDGGVLFGTALLGSKNGARAVHLHLPGTQTPLAVPLLNLVTYDWGHVTPGDRRQPLDAALDAGDVWHALPPHAGNARAFAWLAAALTRLCEQATLTPERRAMLAAAAAQLTEVAAAGGVGGQRPRGTPSAGTTAPAKPGPDRAAPPSYADATAPRRPTAALLATAAVPAAPPAPASSASPVAARGASPSSPAPAPSPSRVPAVGHDRHPAHALSAQALQRALAALTPRQHGATLATLAGAGGGRACSAGSSTPTLRGDDTSPSSEGHWSDAPEEAVHSDATSALFGPEDDASSPSSGSGSGSQGVGGASPQTASTPPSARKIALAAVAEASAADAWALLARTPALAAHLPPEPAARLLAEPPTGGLRPALVTAVQGWLRRLAAQPAEALPFLRHHGEVSTTWQREPALLTDLGRLLVHWPRAESSPRPIQRWLAAAAAYDDGAPWLQVLQHCALGSPLYDEALLALLVQAEELPEETVTAFVRLTGEKLARKRALDAEARREYEQTLTHVLGFVPKATAGLDLTQPYAWRMLAACRAAPRTLGLEAAVAATTRPSATPNAVALLADAGRGAPVDMQLELASKLLVKHPWDLALAREIAATLVRNKKALTGAGTALQPLLLARSVRIMLAVCAEAGEAWTPPASEVAATVWRSLEGVQFAVPFLLARGAVAEAASIVHAAQGHAILSAQSLARLACELPEGHAEQLAQALDDTSGRDVLRVQASCHALHRRLRTRSQQAVDRLKAGLDRSLEADKAWKAVAATRSLLRWATDDVDGALFHSDGRPGAHLQDLLTHMARRHAQAPWHPAEQPVRKLRRLLARSPTERARLATYLQAGIAAQQDFWATMSLSQPVVEALLDATPVPRERRQLAEQFERACGLWPVVAGDDGVSHNGTMRENHLPARAELAQALLPALLADNPTARLPHPLEVNRRRAKLHAVIVHVLREPDHRTWRLPALLRQTKDGGALTMEQLAGTARAGMSAVLQERFAKRDRGEMYGAICLGFEVAWSVGKRPELGTPPAEALLDGVADAIDAHATPAEAYSVLHAVLAAAKRCLARRGTAARDEALMQALLRRLWTRTLQAGVVVDRALGEHAPHGNGLLAQEGALPAYLALQAWLAAPEPDAVSRGYAAVARAWCGGARSSNLDDKPVALALEATALACVDLQLRAAVLAAMAAHGAPVPTLNTALLLAMMKRRPPTPPDRATLARIAGGPEVLAVLEDH